MTIYNTNSNVPTTVRAVFDSSVPFGSDFVYYCTAYGSGQAATYEALYRPIGSSQINKITAVRQSNGTYVFSYQYDISGDFSTISTTHPENVYTSVPGAGQYYELPSGNSLMIVCMVVLASLAILKTVFGGIKWVRSRKYRV